MINTPELFNKLKAGEFDVVQLDIFVVTYNEPDSHVFHALKYFASSKYHMLAFQERSGSYICIEPQRKIVAAHFISGHRLIEYIPHDYRQYYLALEKEYATDELDIQIIFEWQKAKILWILGESDVASGIQDNLFPGGKLNELEDLFFHVTNSTHLNLRSREFLTRFEFLNVATFHRSKKLTEEQFDVFMKRQFEPNGWKCVERKHLQYKCVEKHWDLEKLSSIGYLAPQVAYEGHEYLSRFNLGRRGLIDQQ